MRVLLDECLPHRLRYELPGHVVLTVAEQGWSGQKDGALLQLMQTEAIEALITMDKGIEFQQNLAATTVGIVLLRALTNRFDDLKPLMPEVADQLTVLRPGQFLTVRS